MTSGGTCLSQCSKEGLQITQIEILLHSNHIQLCLGVLAWAYLRRHPIESSILSYEIYTTFAQLDAAHYDRGLS